MNKIIVEIPVDFTQFIKKAEEIIADNGYEDEDVIALAKHQSIIHQTEAFNKAADLINNQPDCNVSVEPIRLNHDNTITIYQATYNEFSVECQAVKTLIDSRNTENWPIRIE